MHELVSGLNRHFETFVRARQNHQHMKEASCWKPQEQHAICSIACAEVGTQLAVGADKDPKRHIIMDHLGYSCRLLKGYLGDREYYECMGGMTKTEMADLRNRLARSYLPIRICKRNLFESNCQHAYHKYKTKCLDVHGWLY